MSLKFLSSLYKIILIQLGLIITVNIVKCDDYINSPCRGQLYLIKIRDRINPLVNCDGDGLRSLYLNDINKEYLVNALNIATVDKAVIGRILNGKEDLIILDKNGNIISYSGDLDVNYIFCFKKYKHNNKSRFRSKCSKDKCLYSSYYHSNNVSSYVKSDKKTCKESIISSNASNIEEISRNCPLLKMCKALKCSLCLQPCSRTQFIKMLCMLLKKECSKNYCKLCSNPKQIIFCDTIQTIIRCLVNQLCHCSMNNNVEYNKPIDTYTNISWKQKLKGIKSSNNQQKINNEFNPLVYDPLFKLPDKSDDKNRILRSAKIMKIITGGHL